MRHKQRILWRKLAERRVGIHGYLIVSRIVVAIIAAQVRIFFGNSNELSCQTLANTCARQSLEIPLVQID